MSYMHQIRFDKLNASLCLPLPIDFDPSRLVPHLFMLLSGGHPVCNWPGGRRGCSQAWRLF